MKSKLIILLLACLSVNINAQKKIDISSNFNKIIVSPHIEAILKKGNEASIEIENISVPMEKFNYELDNKTLQVYLEGAKTYTKNKKVVYSHGTRKVPLYKNKVVKVIITYTDVEIFSLRGEEKIIIDSPIIQNKCKLRIYGKSEVDVNKIDVDELRIAIYGDSYLNIKSGNIKKQKITAYGASTVMAEDVNTKETKITAYGDGTFKLNASEKIKVNAYGEANILYKGSASFKSGIIIGESNIRRID